MQNTLRFFLKVLFSLFCMFQQQQAESQAGEFDSTFNGKGWVFGGFDHTGDFGYGNAIQADGKLLVAGFVRDTITKAADCTIVRYNEDGSFDSSFGIAGRVRTNLNNGQYSTEHFTSIALQSDGKIIAAATIWTTVNVWDGVVIRYLANGTVDSSFGTNGIVVSNFNPSLTGRQQNLYTDILPDGKILLTGSIIDDPNSSDFLHFFARYLPDGRLDNTFGEHGVVKTGLRVGGKPAIQPDGRIVIMGAGGSEQTEFLISRYLANGAPDNSFNITGSVLTFIDSLGAYPNVATIQYEGKIIIGGRVMRHSSYDNGIYSSDLAFVRYYKNGRVDSSFGTSGILTTHFYETSIPTDIALLEDGRFIVGGSTAGNLVAEGPYLLARYLPNGTLDSSFSEDGKKIYDNFWSFEGRAFGMRLRDKRIYLSGYANRYLDELGSGGATGMNTMVFKHDVVAAPPSDINICPGLAACLLAGNVKGSSFQWQVATQYNSFANINDNELYTGATGANLILKNIPDSFNGYQYRCVSNMEAGTAFTVHFLNTFTGAINDLWENPGNWSCGKVPGLYSNVSVSSGQVLVNANTIINRLTATQGAVVTVVPGVIFIIKDREHAF